MGTLLQYSFEGGTNGGAATTGTTGASAITAGVFTHQSSAAKIGSLGLQCINTVSCNARFPITAGLSAAVTFWFKPPTTSSGWTLRTFATLRTSAGVIGRWQYNYASGTTVTVNFVPAAGGSAISLGTFTSGSFYRISAWFTVATSTTGIAHHQIWDSTGAQVGSDVDVTNANLGTTNIAAVDLGVLASMAENPTLQYDALQTEDGRTSYLSDMVTAVDYTASPADSAGGTDAVAISRTTAAADGAGVTDTGVDQTLTLAIDVTDAAGGTDSATDVSTVARTSADAAGGTDSATSSAAGSRTTPDAAGAADAATATLGASRTVPDAAGASDAVTIELIGPLASNVDDTAGAADTVTTTSTGERTQGDAAGISDSVLAVLSRVVTVSDLLGVIDAAQAAAARQSSAADAAGVSDGIEVTLDRRVLVADAVGVMDARTVTVELPAPSETPTYRTIRARAAPRAVAGGGNRTIRAMKRRQ